MFHAKLVMLLVILLAPAVNDVPEKESRSVVSVFSVKQEKVVLATRLTPDVQQNVIQALEDSPSHYGGYTLEPRSGWIAHVPFASPIAIPDSIYSDRIKEVYVYLEPNQNAKALVFYVSSGKFTIVVLKPDAESMMRKMNLRAESLEESAPSEQLLP
ncbi:hypothetical protein [Cohnella terricola]|uniref:Uncharacterized protein n=1 Tax=Cohnella terricola TaxID=1289167 RepID=A0A559J621_9BACL|nr:hypothetical protein [Cohnella terricola]TVX95329.1 hypothetical protein FPZ45_23810 [Cohnella terricola]